MHNWVDAVSQGGLNYNRAWLISSELLYNFKWSFLLYFGSLICRFNTNMPFYDVAGLDNISKMHAAPNPDPI